MSLKAKLATTIAALCMVICLLTVGVWAASEVNVNLSGKVSFVADDVYATVAVKTSGHAEESVEKSVTFNCSSTAAESDNKLGTETWDTGFDFNFKDKAPIVFTFTITNLGERKVDVNITAEATEADANIEFEIDKATDQLAEKPESGESKATYTVTMTIKDTNKAFKDTDYSIKVNLKDVPVA